METRKKPWRGKKARDFTVVKPRKSGDDLVDLVDVDELEELLYHQKVAEEFLRRAFGGRDIKEIH